MPSQKIAEVELSDLSLSDLDTEKNNKKKKNKKSSSQQPLQKNKANGANNITEFTEDKFFGQTRMAQVIAGHSNNSELVKG